MSADPKALRDLAISFAERVAKRHTLGGVGDIATKSSLTDPVTDVDRDSEAIVTEAILGARPDDGVLGEEGASIEGTSGVRWIVDPLDGTVNYLYGFPSYAVSIAASVDDEVVAGVVHDTALDKVYAAAKGHGATCNGATIRANPLAETAAALIATGFGYSPRVRETQVAILARFLPQVRDIRRAGAAAVDLCFVASGQVDGYYETGPNTWDVAAGMLIVTEAGGTASYDPDSKRVIASGNELFDSLDRLISASEMLANSK